MRGLTFVLTLLLGAGTACTNKSGTMRTEDLAKLERRGVPLFGNVDMINGTTVREGAVVSVSAGAPIEVKGWAVDRATGSPGRGVVILLNNVLTTCQYGEARPDVAAVTHNPNNTNSGYTCTISGSVWKSGNAALEPILLTSNNGYYEGQKVAVSSRQ